jgi:hypothetical protein
LYKLIAPIVERLGSEKVEKLCAERLSSDGLSAIALEALIGSDISVGQARRSGRGTDIDG